jgi:hypothetical protein
MSAVLDPSSAAAVSRPADRAPAPATLPAGGGSHAWPSSVRHPRPAPAPRRALARARIHHLGLTTGTVRIETGDQSVGGKRAWITSEHSNTLTLSVVTFLYLHVSSSLWWPGTSVPRERRAPGGAALHTSGLRPARVRLGKVHGNPASFGLVLIVQLVWMLIVYQRLTVRQRRQAARPVPTSGTTCARSSPSSCRRFSS